MPRYAGRPGACPALCTKLTRRADPLPRACRIACTLQLLCFFFIAVFALHPIDYYDKFGSAYDEEPWPHFFKMPVLMLMLITVLNDGTLISVAYDHVVPSPWPEKWNLKVLALRPSRLLYDAP